MFAFFSIHIMPWTLLVCVGLAISSVAAIAVTCLFLYPRAVLPETASAGHSKVTHSYQSESLTDGTSDSACSDSIGNGFVRYRWIQSMPYSALSERCRTEKSSIRCLGTLSFLLFTNCLMQFLGNYMAWQKVKSDKDSLLSANAFEYFGHYVFYLAHFPNMYFVFLNAASDAVLAMITLFQFLSAAFVSRQRPLTHTSIVIFVYAFAFCSIVILQFMSSALSSLSAKNVLEISNIMQLTMLSYTLIVIWSKQEARQGLWLSYLEFFT